MKSKAYIALKGKKQHGMCDTVVRFVCNKKKVLLPLCVILLYLCCKDNRFNKFGRNKPSLAISGDGNQFILRHTSGHLQPLHIVSGAMHYFRIVPQYWEDRIIKLKASGLNTLETYVPWNLHEPSPGHYTFSGGLDLVAYLQLAHKHGLYVILRPGPYICAEWDFGGLPGWLLADESMRVRSMHPGYIKAVTDYFNKLIPMILPYQYNHQGPIIMLQVENEYGSYRQDTQYVKWLADLLLSLGVSELLMTSDGFADGKMESGTVPGVLATVNDQKSLAKATQYLKRFQPSKPVMIGEYWTGWFDHWGKEHHTYPVSKFSDSVGYALQNNISISLYMYHGGTTFGFMNGANGKQNHRIDYTVSSYDYDAPVSESGQLSPKFYALQKLLKRYPCSGCSLPWSEVETAKLVRDGPKSKAYGQVNMEQYVTLTQALKTIIPWTIDVLVPMELVCTHLKSQSTNCQTQTYGFIAYRTQIDSSTVNIYLEAEFADRALIIVDGITKSTIEPQKMGSTSKLHVTVEEGSPHDLIILVENMGRVNYNNYPDTSFNRQRKGVINGTIFAGTNIITSWQVYNLDMTEGWVEKLEKDTQVGWNKDITSVDSVQQPVFAKFVLSTDKIGKADNSLYLDDTFLQTKGFTKGQAFVNGFNLGRYWAAGPTKTLYVPGPVLQRRESASVLLFELHKAATSIELIGEPLL